MSIIRNSSSGPFLKQYAAQFVPQIIPAFGDASVDVDVPNVHPGQNIVANFNPIPSANLTLQADCRNPGVVSVYITNTSNAGLNLTFSVNVLFTPI